MEDKILAVANLLQEAGHAHHEAYIATDGDDPDWPLWYADYLVDKLGILLDATLTRTQIVLLLVELDRLQQTTAPGTNWMRFYAKELVNRYF